MALSDPVAVYNAATNLEAHVLCELLAASGIEAFVTEDLSPIGASVLGFIPDLHKPQVWVSRNDTDRTRPILEDYEQRSAERRAAAESGQVVDGPGIEAACDECGQKSVFPAALRDSVQECPHCGKYMDVSDHAPSDESFEEETDEPA
jgi:hypothetical protein